MSNLQVFLRHFDRIHQAISPKTINGKFEHSSFVCNLKSLRGKDKAVTNNFDALKKFAEFRNIDAHSNHMAPYFPYSTPVVRGVSSRVQGQRAAEGFAS